jgi:D-3-phosphoglycerate dehydrogenase / 2-oxoglutarate reductase
VRQGLRVLVLTRRDHPHWDQWTGPMVSEVSRHHPTTILDLSRPVAEQVAESDCVVDMSGLASKDLAEAAAGRVRLWQFTSVGYDHWDIASLLEHGVPVAACPGSTSAVGLAEMALGMAVMVSRRFTDLDRAMRSGTGGAAVGRELRGRMLLVLGLGASGEALAVRARAFGMRVVAVRRGGVDPALAKELGLAGSGRFEDLDMFLPDADVVSLHVPLAPGTEHLLNRNRLFAMKPGAIVVNVSRGGLIDEAALVDALEAGHLGGAGLDVLAREPVDPRDPLLGMRNVLVTPHVAGLTEETAIERGRFAAANIDRVAAGLEPFNRVLDGSRPQHADDGTA